MMCAMDACYGCILWVVFLLPNSVTQDKSLAKRLTVSFNQLHYEVCCFSIQISYKLYPITHKKIHCGANELNHVSK